MRAPSKRVLVCTAGPVCRPQASRSGPEPGCTTGPVPGCTTEPEPGCMTEPTSKPEPKGPASMPEPKGPTSMPEQKGPKGPTGSTTARRWAIHLRQPTGTPKLRLSVQHERNRNYYIGCFTFEVFENVEFRHVRYSSKSLLIRTFE